MCITICEYNRARLGSKRGVIDIACYLRHDNILAQVKQEDKIAWARLERRKEAAARR